MGLNDFTLVVFLHVFWYIKYGDATDCLILATAAAISVVMTCIGGLMGESPTT